MTLRALKFIHGAASVGPFRCSLEGPPPAAFAKLKAQGMYAAYIVCESDLDSFRKSSDLFLDRRKKHAAKALADLLLGHKKIPLISSGYLAVGRLTQGVEALLGKAAKKDERNLYIIGTSDKIFDELWRTSDPKSRSIASQRKSGRAKFDKTHANKPDDWRDKQHATKDAGTYSDSMSSQLILEMLPDEDIPEDLTRTYLGTSVEAQMVRHFIMRAARSHGPVLIIGDTGTGKEIVARAIHDHSKRSTHQFVAVNCSAIPRELLEAELFGTIKGGATNISTRIGLWELADSGTLFLDEIGDLLPEHQAKILRALEAKTIRRVGETRERVVRARVVAATNRDLFAMVQAGHFREDLYYRLRWFMIRTPTMRNHPDDIPVLAQALWKIVTHSENAVLPPAIISRILQYRWPGNVRELAAVLMNVYNLFGRNNLGKEHLEAVFHLQGQGEVSGDTPSPAGEIMLHRVECLRHLGRVDEVVRACKVTLRPVIAPRKISPDTIEAVDSAFRHRLSELELLCLRPLLFNSEVAFSVVYRLKGKLSYLQSLLKADARKARSFWKKELADEFRLTLTAVFQEVERLTARD
jgi:transcriptional regulator with AAA-type ATPase domain